MKKLISSTLALTMLATPLISSTCFADETNNPNGHYVQNEDRSEPFKEKKCDSQKTRKILAGVAAGTIALTGVTTATLKLCENQLPESLKVKFPFLFTKKAQETQENIKTEKIPETVTETETTKDENTKTVVTESEVSKNQTVETVTADSNITKNETIKTVAVEPEVSKNQTVETVTADSNVTKNETIEAAVADPVVSKNQTVETVTADSNITKNEAIEPLTTKPSISMNKTIETVATESNITKNETTIETIAAELNITKKENTGSVAVNSNTTKNETADIEAIKAKIIQSLAKNNTTNDADDTSWLNTLKSTTENVWNSAKDFISATPTQIKYAGYAALTVLFFLGGYRARKGINNFLAKRKAAAAAAALAAEEAAEKAAVARATEAAPALNALKEQFTQIAAEAATKAAIIAEEKTFMDTMGNVADFFIKEAADAAAVGEADVAATVAADAAATVAAAGKAKFVARTIVNGKTVLKEMADGTFRLFGKETTRDNIIQILQAGNFKALINSIKNFVTVTPTGPVTAFAKLCFSDEAPSNAQEKLDFLLK